MLLRYLYLTDGGRVGARFDEMPQTRMRTRAGLRELYAKNSCAMRSRMLQENSLLLDSLYAKDRTSTSSCGNCWIPSAQEPARHRALAGTAVLSSDKRTRSRTETSDQTKS